MRIYICAGGMSYTEASKVSSFLEKHGHIVHFAAQNRPLDIPDEHVFLNNLVQIRNADLFLAFFTGDGLYDVDYGVQVGMASEAGKPIVGYLDVEKDHHAKFYEKFEKDYMFKEAFTGLFSSIEEFGRYLLSI